MLDERTYDSLAGPALQALRDAVDALGEPTLEAELESDILTLEFDDGARYVINSHRAARQIWMAAERTAWHFDWDAAERSWVAAKSGDELYNALERALSAKLGHAVRLGRPAG